MYHCNVYLDGVTETTELLSTIDVLAGIRTELFQIQETSPLEPPNFFARVEKYSCGIIFDESVYFVTKSKIY